MAEVGTERKRKAFEGKIEGADKVEIKITVARKDEERAYEALEVGRRDAARREIYSGIEDGRTIPATTDASVTGDLSAPLMDIKWSHEGPQKAFTAVRSRDHWYWIDDHDFASKRSFAFLTILFSLMETGGKEGLPVVTIPAS